MAVVTPANPPVDEVVTHMDIWCVFMYMEVAVSVCMHITLVVNTRTGWSSCQCLNGIIFPLSMVLLEVLVTVGRRSEENEGAGSKYR